MKTPAISPAAKPTVTAHSGAFNTPDNSLEFVRKALAENCDILEIDVTFRPSGKPVIIHKGAPDENEGVPLEDAFRLIADHPAIRMNLDLKSIANLPAIDALLREYGLFDRAFFTGVEETGAAAVKAGSKVPYYLNAGISFGERRGRRLADALAKRLIALGAVGLNVHYGSVTPTVVRAMHENGLPVSLWTANTKKAMRRCIALGADNVTTRHPDALWPLLNETEGKV